MTYYDSIIEWITAASFMLTYALREYGYIDSKTYLAIMLFCVMVLCTRLWRIINA